MMPKVSLLVPTIGRMAYLPSMEASIRAQTLDDYEILVLDNACGDEARAYLAGWVERDSRVRVLRVEQRLPMFDNFQRGIEAASCQYVSFIHDDDVYLPTYLAAQVRALDAHPRVGVSGSNFDFIDENGTIIEQRRWVGHTEVWSGARFIQTLMGRGRNPIPMPGLVFRRSVFDKVAFNQGLSPHFGDFTLLMRMAEDWDYFVHAERLINVRKHAGQASLSHALGPMVTLRTATLRAYAREYIERHPSDAEFMRRLLRRLEFQHRVGVLWGFLVDPSPLSIEPLGSTPVDKIVEGLAMTLERTHLREKIPALRMREHLRGLAKLIGV